MTLVDIRDRISHVPGIRRRRVHVWAVMVTAIVAMLIIQSVVPGWRFVPDLGGHLGHHAVLAIFLAALICEYVDSSLGMGYGTTLTPMLLLAGFDPLQIVPCVLLSEFITGLGAGLMHHRDGNVDLIRDRKVRKTLVLLSLLSVVGAVAAVTLALSIPKFWLKLIIAIIILSIGVVILATIRHQLAYRRSRMIVIGAIAAFNKGLSGGGYGPLVTGGQVVSGMPAKSAVAVTSLTESLTCLVGLSAYMLLLRGHVDFALAVPLTIGACLSVPIATLTVRRLPEGFMRSSVGVTTCALGLFTLAKIIW
ncbi:MAG: sulfite exporter TauE/SafE family protein [Phycisphaerales bacterium]|nr:sulfite exporter TauE/SafE family protein [Phycisphaerales bacterium]